MLVAVLEKLLTHHSLSQHEAHDVLRHVLNGDASDAQIAGLLMALAMKGETVDELVGFARAMREQAAVIEPPVVPQASGPPRGGALTEGRKHGWRLVDTCGTGGNPRKTFNISTAAAFVTAAAGVPVAKHGNRSHTSRSGSADVMAALGVNLEMPVSQLGRCLQEVGIAFFYAPLLHTAMRNVQPARRALQVRTIFNLLGPLTNPAGAEAQVVGVPHAALLGKMASALRDLGVQRAFVVHGEDGLGELTTTALTQVAEIEGKELRTYTVDARDFGIPRATPDSLAGGDADENAQVLKEIFQGRTGPKRDVVVLNTAAALLAGNRVASLADGIELAVDVIDSGVVMTKVQQLIAFSRSSAAEAASQSGTQ